MVGRSGVIILWGSCGSESLGSKTLGSKTLVPGTSNRRSVGCSGSASMLVVSTREASRRMRGSRTIRQEGKPLRGGEKGRGSLQEEWLCVPLRVLQRR